MSKQVLSIEQMQHLKELGVDDSNSSVYWHRIRRLNTGEVVTDWFKSFNKSATCLDSMKVETVPAFTFQDIFELMPKKLPAKDGKPVAFLEIIFPNDDVWEISYGRLGYVSDSEFNAILIDAAYEMLCWLIENGYVDTKK